MEARIKIEYDSENEKLEKSSFLEILEELFMKLDF